jgi:4-amino-4-deoxy-L-arabinose transferase-like glycosyltransferase
VEKLFSSNYTKILLILILSLTTSLIFTFTIYPALEKPLDIPLDIDKHGLMGKGLYEFGTFSYYPDSDPSIARGPVYPALIALCLFLSNNSYPVSIQIAQCILFAGTSLLVYSIGFSLWGNIQGFIAGIICSIHPYLIWFTSRIYVEVFGTFLFTLLVALLIYFSLKPSFFKALLVGCLISVATLTKTTFLPFIFIIPLFLVVSRTIIESQKKRIFYSLAIFISSLLMLFPWTLRNWNLTHHFIPVQVLFGYNLQIGDGFFEIYDNSHLSWKERLKKAWIESYKNNVLPIEEKIIKTKPRAHLSEREWDLEEIAREKSFHHYLENPLFLVKKVLYNSIGFWFAAPTLNRSILLVILQTPLLILFLCKTVTIFTNHIFSSIQGLHIILVWSYYFFHLPVLPGGRFSVVLIPTMIAYSISLLAFAISQKRYSSKTL